jgi:site-specific recombinase XerD
MKKRNKKEKPTDKVTEDVVVHSIMPEDEGGMFNVHTHGLDSPDILARINTQLKGIQMKQVKQGKRTRVLGLSWVIRRDKKLWEKTIKGKRYTSTGNGSGFPTEHSAEVAWADIKQKMERKNHMHGITILNPSLSPLPQVVVEATAPVFNIIEEINRYLALQTQRQQIKEISVHGLATILRDTGDFRDWLNRQEIETITADTLQRYASWQLQRYADGFQKRATLEKKLSYAKKVVKWLWRSEVLDNMPRNLETVFRVKKPKNEKKVSRVKVYSDEEIITILAEAPERTKLYILLALNCGMYWADIADLKHGEFNGTHVTRCRTKTGEQGSWMLWKETKRLLEKYATNKDDSETMLLHKDGTELYWYKRIAGKMRRCNHMQSSFADLLERLEISGTFRQLRRTGSSLVRDESDSDTAKLHLANSKDSIAEKYYLADNFEGLNAALRKVEKRLGIS